MIRTILLAVTICALCAGSWAAPLYTLTDLGTIPGDTGSEACRSRQIVFALLSSCPTRFEVPRAQGHPIVAWRTAVNVQGATRKEPPGDLGGGRPGGPSLTAVNRTQQSSSSDFGPRAT